MKTAQRTSKLIFGKIPGALLALFLFTQLGHAQEASSGGMGSGPIDINVYELIKNQGGPIIYPLAIISVVTVLMIFFFFITIRGNRVVSDRFMRNAEILIRKEDYEGLITECNRTNESMAHISERAVEFMVKNPGASFDEVREVAMAEGSRQSSMLNNRISYLSDIGSISTMLGLLGTVIGMIVTFIRISQGNVDGVQQMKVAEGVYPALITTGLGLSIGIVALIFYSVFRGKVQKYISDLESASTHLMALLAAQHNKFRRSSNPARIERPVDMSRQYFEEEDIEELNEGFAIPENSRSRVVRDNAQGNS
jgi:biopolymer transport protein ExbB